MVQEELPPDFTTINSLEDILVGLKSNYFRLPKEESQVFLKILNKSSD
jgi:hypothetical protein